MIQYHVTDYRESVLSAVAATAQMCSSEPREKTTAATSLFQTVYEPRGDINARFVTNKDYFESTHNKNVR